MKAMQLTNPNLPSRPKPPVDPRVKAMAVLDAGMQTALTREDLPVEERLQQYDQSLARYMNVYDKFNPTANVVEPKIVAEPKTVEPPVKDSDPLKEETLNSVPPSMKRKAEQLWHRMKASQIVDWNEKGELKYKGNVVKGSNVVDLVNDVLRQRKRFNPTGWEVFAEALREENVPQNLIGHDKRWDYIRGTPRQRKDSVDDTFATPMKTPASTPRLPKQWAQYKGKSTVKRN